MNVHLYVICRVIYDHNCLDTMIPYSYLPSLKDENIFTQDIALPVGVRYAANLSDVNKWSLVKWPVAMVDVV